MSLLQLDAMLAESGLAESGLAEPGLDQVTAWPPTWVEDLDDVLAPLAELDAPAPSGALLAAFGEAPVTSIPRLRVARSRSTMASVLVLAVSTVGATGLSAAANTLPPSLQRNVSDFSRHYLPFVFPQPSAPAAVRPHLEQAPPPARHPLTGRPAEQPATHHAAHDALRGTTKHHVVPAGSASQGAPVAPTAAHQALEKGNGKGKAKRKGAQDVPPPATVAAPQGGGGETAPTDPGNQGVDDSGTTGGDATGDSGNGSVDAAPRANGHKTASPATSAPSSSQNGNGNGNGNANGKSKDQGGQQDDQGVLNSGQAAKAAKAAAAAVVTPAGTVTTSNGNANGNGNGNANGNGNGNGRSKAVPTPADPTVTTLSATPSSTPTTP